jgi:hypothetical protein
MTKLERMNGAFDFKSDTTTKTARVNHTFTFRSKARGDGSPRERSIAELQGSLVL